MVRLEIMQQNENNSSNVIKNPFSDPYMLASFYNEKLAEAAASQTELLCFDAIELAEKKSSNFQNIYMLEKCIMDFLMENEFPKKVRILCDAPEAAELYKVVYNFYYPGCKAERLDDDNWD